MTFEERLAKAVLAFGQTSELPDLLGKICSQCQALFGVHGVYLWQKQDKDLVGVAACGYMEEHFVGSYAMLSEAVFAAAVARQGHAQLSANYQKEEIYTKHFPPKEGLVSLLGLPLSSDGAVEGVLVMADTEIEDRFTIDDVEQATQFCEHAAAAVRRCRNLLDTKDQIDQLKISISQQESQLNQERKRVHYLYRLTDELSEVMDQDSVIRIVLELVSEVTGSSQSAILTVDTSSGKFSYPSAYRTQGIHPLTGAIEDHGLHWKIAKRVVETRASVIAVQKGSDSQELRIPDGLGLGSAIGVPLMAKEEVAGVLLLFHEDPKAFSEDQVPLIEAAAYQVGTNIRNAQLFTLIRHQTERLGQLLRQESISAAKSKAILECIADGVVVVDALGIVTLANVAAKEFLSLTNQELIGRRVSDHKNLYALFGDKWTEVARDWARGSSPDQSHSFLAHTLELNQKYVGVQLSPIFANEKYFGTVAVFRDVTHDIETERAKNEFVSTVSHELRTPMTSIKGYTDLMLMGMAGGMTEEQKNYLSVIKGNADRVTVLVNDLLDVARMESGKTDLDLKEVNVAGLLTIAANDHLRGLIENGDKVIEMRLNLEPSLPDVMADPDRLLQVFTNLIDNAYNYTPSGGAISIDAKAAGDDVQITFADTGIGIKEENLSHIFERYYRADDDRIKGITGTGLGLSIVRSLVLLHGGTIEVESKVNRGTRFIIKLPIFISEMRRYQEIQEQK